VGFVSGCTDARCRFRAGTGTRSARSARTSGNRRLRETRWEREGEFWDDVPDLSSASRGTTVDDAG
jgi:hypothetical protein